MAILAQPLGLRINDQHVGGFSTPSYESTHNRCTLIIFAHHEPTSRLHDTGPRRRRDNLPATMCDFGSSFFRCSILSRRPRRRRSPSRCTHTAASPIPPAPPRRMYPGRRAPPPKKVAAKFVSCFPLPVIRKFKESRMIEGCESVANFHPSRSIPACKRSSQEHLVPLSAGYITGVGSGISQNGSTG